MRILIYFLLFHLWGNLKAQGFDLLVKKGAVNISSKLINQGGRYRINVGDVIIPQKYSLLLVTNGKEIYEISGVKEMVFNDIKKLFKGKNSFSESFLKVILNQNISPEKNSGETSRGSVSVDLWNFYPPDSVIILSDSIKFIVGDINSNLVTDIVLYRTNSKDTIYLNKKSNNHFVKTPDYPGRYEWIYKLQNKKEVNSFLNFFIVPNESEKKLYLNDFKIFLEGLEKFSDQMKHILIQDYLDLNNIIVKL
jgi:hypothetical protein